MTMLMKIGLSSAKLAQLLFFFKGKLLKKVNLTLSLWRRKVLWKCTFLFEVMPRRIAVFLEARKMQTNRIALRWVTHSSTLFFGQRMRTFIHYKILFYIRKYFSSLL